MPLEKTAPTSIPKAAMAIMILKDATFEPMAEFKKLTASLLTPTTRSEAARMNNSTRITK
jgi:hypothetical protein